MNYLDRITIDPLTLSGQPCVRGTRFAVADILDYPGGGMSVKEVLDDFPDLSAADRDRRLNVVPYEAAV
jgi:uncharacterized protein (DUF433 family)